MPKLSGLNADFAREVAMVFQRGIESHVMIPISAAYLKGRRFC